MGEVLFVTPDGGLRKKRKKNLVKLCFERPVLSSSKRARNKHKKNWRTQAKLLDVLSSDIVPKAKKKKTFFSFW